MMYSISLPLSRLGSVTVGCNSEFAVELHELDPERPQFREEVSTERESK